MWVRAICAPQSWIDFAHVPPNFRRFQIIVRKSASPHYRLITDAFPIQFICENNTWSPKWLLLPRHIATPIWYTKGIINGKCSFISFWGYGLVQIILSFLQYVPSFHLNEQDVIMCLLCEQCPLDAVALLVSNFHFDMLDLSSYKSTLRMDWVVPLLRYCPTTWPTGPHKPLNVCPLVVQSCDSKPCRHCFRQSKHIVKFTSKF